MVRKFGQPDHSTKTQDVEGARAWMSEIESALPVLSVPLGYFAPCAAVPASLSVQIDGGFIVNGLGIAPDVTSGGVSEATNMISVAPQSVTIETPVAHRIDRIYIDSLSGVVGRVVGVDSSSADAPAYPDGVIPVCRVELAAGQTVITNAHIVDERGQINTDSPMAVSGGGETVFGDVLGYKLWDTPGSYTFFKPPQARFCRIAIGGAGGGGGGCASNAAVTTYAGGGGGGGGCVIEGLVMMAEDFSVVVGSGGSGGNGGNILTTTNGVAGGSGGASTVTRVATGVTISAAGGSGGAGATTATPTVGAGGAGGAAGSFGGVAGQAGSAGTTGTDATLAATGGKGGSTGVSQQLSLGGKGASQSLNTPSVAGRLGSGGGGGGWPGTGQVYKSKGNDGGHGFVLIEWF